MSKSLITIDGLADGASLAPVSPGELLKEEFLVPLGISQYRLAKETGIPAQRIGQIVLGRLDYGRYRPQTLPLLWSLGWVLAACSGGIRRRGCASRAGA